jgi:hypothetical protein
LRGFAAGFAAALAGVALAGLAALVEAAFGLVAVACRMLEEYNEDNDLSRTFLAVERLVVVVAFLVAVAAGFLVVAVAGFFLGAAVVLFFVVAAFAAGLEAVALAAGLAVVDLV